MENFKWQVCVNMGLYQVWRQTRPLRYGEPMHSGVRETAGVFDTKADAEEEAARLNHKEEADSSGAEDCLLCVHRKCILSFGKVE